MNTRKSEQQLVTGGRVFRSDERRRRSGERVVGSDGEAIVGDGCGGGGQLGGGSLLRSRRQASAWLDLRRVAADNARTRRRLLVRAIHRPLRRGTAPTRVSYNVRQPAPLTATNSNIARLASSYAKKQTSTSTRCKRYGLLGTTRQLHL